MKKLMLFTGLIFLLVGLSAADTKKDDSVVYRNLPIYKVYVHPEAYVIMYQDAGIELGQTTVPVEWFAAGNGKGVLRTLPGTFAPYMLLQYTDGTFTKIILNMPQDRTNVAWGIMNGTVDTETGSKTDTLVLE